HLRIDVQQGPKNGVVVYEGSVDWDKRERLPSHNKDRFQDPTSNLPSEGSVGRIQDTNSTECGVLFRQPVRKRSQVVTCWARDAHEVPLTMAEDLIGGAT